MMSRQGQNLIRAAPGSPATITGSTPQSSTLVTPAVETTNEEDVSGITPTEAEEGALQHENLEIGEDQQEQVDARETWTKAGDEDDRFNTTV